MPAESARPGGAKGAAANGNPSTDATAADASPSPSTSAASPTPPSATATRGAPGAPPPSVTAEFPASPDRPHAEDKPKGKRLAVLTLTALGIVYGDIGTSPLYAFKECFSGGAHAVPPTVPNVYGVLSLIVWSLTLVVSVKYITFIMRADNRGEGGILALLALILQRQHRVEDSRRRFLYVALGLFGAALLYGDGIITPAISVLGAVEGLNVITPRLSDWIVILTVGILAVLFYFQQFGTDKVGKAFGPLMLIWFGSIAGLGAAEIMREPVILSAINPLYGLRFFGEHGFHGFVILGSVVLAVTGAEALYADMGHFGKRPIRLAWFAFVFPCLLVNYFGQGALLLRDPSAAINPFYLLAPRVLLYPLLVVATLAAIVASQALISGAFSLTQQSVQLGYSPRVTIVHTSHHAAGQIYIPEVNKALAVGCVLVVLGFRSSTALGAAYGIAVTGTMAITTLLFYQIERHRWGWPLWKAIGLAAGFLVIDLAFFGANALKVAQGGWVPLVVAIAMFTLMTTWKRGRELLREILRRGTLPLDMFLADVARRKPVRVSGTAVFMTSEAEGAPVVLLHHLKHNKVLHEQVVLLSVASAEVPDVDEEAMLQVDPLGQGFYRVKATYGFMETPNVPDIMRFCNKRGLKNRPNDTSFFLGRERLIPTRGREHTSLKEAPLPRMRLWRKKLFVFMARNARSATEFFGLPPNRVVELGTQIEF
ncbi:MAG TPA: potassium transporter Kup [Gemmatimonadaceae bacterium]|nr:potassium transporter Kup [Gemmatimonadaceae bacterium]